MDFRAAGGSARDRGLGAAGCLAAPVSGRGSRPEAARCRQERRSDHFLHDHRGEGPCHHRPTLREKVSHQDRYLARRHRQGAAAHPERSRRAAFRSRRDPFRLPGNGSTASREDSSAGRFAIFQGPYPGRRSAPPGMGGDDPVGLGAGIQHESHQEGGPAPRLPRPARSQVEGQARHRGQEPGVVLDRVRGTRRRCGHKILPRAGGAQRHVGAPGPFAAHQHGRLRRGAACAHRL